MAKQGMQRPDFTHTKPRNTAPPVPEIQGKAKHGKVRANPIVAGTEPPSQKVYHTAVDHIKEKPIPSVYSNVDDDLGRDNTENDYTNADLQDM